MKSSSQHVFSQVPAINIPRSVFDTSSTYKTTFSSGKLIPFLCREVLPGDTFNLSVAAFARLTTPIVPFMDNVYMDFQFFFVPTRLVWSNWQKFCGEQEDPGDSIDYLVPTLTSSRDSQLPAIQPESNADYMGIPVGVAGLTVNALPFRALNLIWNEWYRPQDLASSKDVPKGDGPDEYNLYKYLLPRYNRLDYFQGCLPSPQRGAGVGIGGLADVPIKLNMPFLPVEWRFHGSGGFIPAGDYSYRMHLHNPSSDVDVPPLEWPSDVGAYPDGSSLFGFEDMTYETMGKWGDLGVPASRFNEGDTRALTIDYGSPTFTINQLREAFQIQLFKEREQLGGSRYREIILSMFGVRSPDARLQIPEYLGGGTIPVQIHAVAQTSASDDTTPQGNLAAYGVAGGRPVGFSKSFTEFGYVIGIVSVRADIAYQQGLDRMWSRRTRFDFYWPVFAHLGEQAVLNKEIYAQGSSATDPNTGELIDDQVFGYQERYAEYRYGRSQITGKLRSGILDSLDVWHLAPYYESKPVLGDTFAQVNVPFSRVLAVNDQPEFVFDSLIKCRCVRPMPIYGQPGRIDHYF